MKSIAVCLLAGLVCAGSSFAASGATGTRAADRTTLSQTSSHDAPSVAVQDALPLVFEPNMGQAAPTAEYIARARGYVAQIGRRSIAVARMAQRQHYDANKSPGNHADRPVPSDILRIQFAGDREPILEPHELLASYSNYFVGKREHWKSHVPNYGELSMRGIRRGVDVRLRGTANLIEFDFELGAGVDPTSAVFTIEGCQFIEPAADGSIRLHMATGQAVLESAVAYQEGSAGRSSVEASYDIRANGTIGFRVGHHDANRPLTIDPIIRFVNAIGGSAAEDEARSVCVDSTGAAYVAGVTTALDFPVTPGALVPGNPSDGLNETAVVSKFSAAGVLVFSTYFPSGSSIASFAVDGAGALYMTGRPGDNFPVTPGAYNTTNGSHYVAKLAPSGSSFVYATYIGSSSFIADPASTSIAVDATGSAYISGVTYTFDADQWPTTPGVFDDVYESGAKPFLTKFTPDGSSLVFSTFLGALVPNPVGYKHFITLDALGSAVVAGTTNSDAFPATPGAYDVTRDGTNDGFVMRVATDGSSLLWSTLVGGSGSETVRGLGISAGGTPAVAVYTDSADYPTTPGAYDSTPDIMGQPLAISRFSADGSSLVYSTYLGEAVVESSMAVDGTGSCFVTGITASTSFPTTPGSFEPDPPTENGPWAFIAKLTPDGSGLAYSSFAGPAASDYGSSSGPFELVDVGPSGSAYIVGRTDDLRFPSINGPAPPLDRSNAFLMRFAASGSSVDYSIRFGGTVGPYSANESAADVAIGADGAPVMVGTTGSLNFPTTAGSWDTTHSTSGRDVFVSKFNAAGTSLVFSTFLGGSDWSEGRGVAVDAAGAVFVCGSTYATDFPVTPGAADPAHVGTDLEGFVAKLSASGASLAYASYLGGTSDDVANRIAVDNAGSAAVAGTTGSADFPTTAGAFDSSLAGASDAFVVRISLTGTSFGFATLIGGSTQEEGADLALDASGRCTVVGRTTSPSFPTTPGAFDVTYGGTGNGVGDGFVSRIAPDGSSLVYSTFLGGTRDDAVAAVALDSGGSAFVTGRTNSYDFPTTSGAFDQTFNTSFEEYPDAFVVKVGPTGSTLAYATFLGTGSNNSSSGYDFGVDIGVDSAGQATVLGTTSSGNYPVTENAPDQSIGGFSDAFVTTFNANGSLLSMSSFLGGGLGENPRAVAVDATGTIYSVGETYSDDFSTRTFGPVHPWIGTVAFLAVIGSPSGTADISVAIVESVDPILTGTGLTYNLTIQNSGPEPALGVSVVLPVGSGMTFSSCTVSQGTFAVPPVGQPGTVLVTLGVLGVGQSATVAVSVNVVAQSGATLVTTATAQTVSSDPSPTNNVATETTGVIATPFAGSDTVGVVVPSSGAFFLKNANAPGSADTVFSYGAGNPAWSALRGDWDGDGDDSIGLYDPATGAFFLRNSNSPGGADLVFTYGGGGIGLVPIVGDWDGNGSDTVGLYAPSSGAFFLRNSNTPGPADVVLTFGAGGSGIVPLAGDWDGDGDDTVGLYLSASATFFLKNSNTPGPADSAFSYGPSALVPLAGDWDNNGFDSIGVFSPSTSAWFLRNSNTPGPADLVFSYGPAGSSGLVGDWDGQ